MGAWIETYSVASAAAVICVAPFVGAWIETGFYFSGLLIDLSLPSWERGLKPADPADAAVRGWVAPFVGAWIETKLSRR